MTTEYGNYNEELSDLRNPKRKFRRNRPQNQRPVAEQFSHLLRKYSHQAARSKDTFKFGAELLHRKGIEFDSEIEFIIEAIDYLIEHQGTLVSYNSRFGDILNALINSARSNYVNTICQELVRKYPENIAANPSMGKVFTALISQSSDLAKDVASYMYSLAIKTPDLLAANPEAGWVIKDLIENDQTEAAVNIFIVISKMHPEIFAENVSKDKAIDAIRELDLVKLVGSSKADFVERLSTLLIEKANGTDTLAQAGISAISLRPSHNRVD